MINQPLIKVFLNEGGGITLVYGASDQREIQTVDLEMIAISKCDAAAIGKALLKCAKEG